MTLIPQVSATYISLSIAANVILLITTSKNATLYLNITNYGDETAYDIEVLLSINTSSFFIGDLPPNKSKYIIIPLDFYRTKPGSYSIVILTKYHDVNGYMFSTVSPTRIIVDRPCFSRINGKFEKSHICENCKTKLKLYIKNLDNEKRKINITLYLPFEFHTEEKNKVIELEANENRELYFEISNNSALTGSSYTILVTIDYELPYTFTSNNSVQHCSSFVIGKIDVINSSYNDWIYLTVIVIILLMMFISKVIEK
jgi:hypothetical protein